jgi:hypothetical protein
MKRNMVLRGIFALVVGISIYAKNQQEMKLYIFYTPSHEKMCNEWFMPSLSPEDDFEVIAEVYDQECDSGNFMQTGWLPTMIHKVDIVLRGIEENWGSVFIHADVDIQFFRPMKALILAAMQDKDMVLQKDHPKGVACAGFFACRGNERTRALWTRIKESLQSEIEKVKKQKKVVKSNFNDQTLLNKFIRSSNPYNIVWDYLPKTFFGGGSLTGKRWKPGNTLPIPEEIVMHHANWTVGVENKIAQLDYVRSEVMSRTAIKSVN